MVAPGGTLLEFGVEAIPAPGVGGAVAGRGGLRFRVRGTIAAGLLAVATTRHHVDSALDEAGTESEPMIVLTRPELLRLLRTFALPTPVTTPEHVLHWSRW